MEQFEICSVDDLHRVLQENWEQRSLYRGEDSASYELRPKYGRFQAQDARNDKAKEIALLDEFKRRAVPMTQQSPENDWEWLALAQHFGLATRLLDWTENPLIAAYFATKWNFEKRDRVLYALDEDQSQSAKPSISPFDIEDVVLYRPKHLSTRISAQGGVFTVHPSPGEPLDDNRIKKWVIKQDCVLRINITLQSYGINEAFIFQDLEGLARHLNAMYVWGIVG